MITQKRLKEILTYNKESGIFVWKKKTSSKSNRTVVGDIAGSVTKNGYIVIKIDGKLHFAHRLAWLYINGIIPKEQIDHKDHDRTNNRILNLREATHRENMKNLSKRKNNKTGIMGVILREGRGRKPHYEARITVDGKRHHLGCFSELEDAKKAREEANIKYNFKKEHGE